MQSKLYTLFLLVLSTSILLGGNIDLSKYSEKQAREYVRENLSQEIYQLEGEQILLKLDTITILVDLYSIDSMRPDLYYLKAYSYAEYEDNDLLGIEYAKKALEEAVKYNNTDVEVDALLKLVELYAQIYDYDQSFQYSKRAKKRASETGDIRRIATVNMTLAYAHDKYDEYAAELYRDAYRMVGRVKHNNVVVLLNNFGRVFLFMDPPQLDSAVYYLEKARVLKEELGAASLGKVEANLAEAYFAQKNYEEAGRLCRDVLNIDEEKLTTVEAFNCRRILATTTFANGQQELARKYIEEGVELAREYPFLHKLIKKFTTTSKQVSEDLGDLKMYALLDSLHQNAVDSVIAEEELQRVSIIQSKMALDEKQEMVEKQENISFSRLLVLLALAAALLLGVIAFYQYAKRQKIVNSLKDKELELLKSKEEARALDRKTNKMEAEFDERQASTNLIHLKEKQKILQEVQEKLAGVDREKLSPKSSESLIEIERLIDENLKSEQQWNSFLLHYENMHPAFFNKLKEEYPEISQQDRRLIAYLKMDLSSKEIAQLMGVNHQSVNKSRYRLRKKLDVPKGVKLDDFLHEF